MPEEENRCKHCGLTGTCLHPRAVENAHPCFLLNPLGACDSFEEAPSTHTLEEIPTPPKPSALADILKALVAEIAGGNRVESVTRNTPLGSLEVHVHDCWEEDESVPTYPPWLVLTLSRPGQDDIILDLVPKTDIEFGTPTTQEDIHEAVRRNMQYDETTLATYLKPTSEGDWATSLFQPVSDNLAGPALLVRSRHLTPRECVVLAAVYECEARDAQAEPTLVPRSNKEYGHKTDDLLRTHALAQAREWDGEHQVKVTLGQLVSLGVLTTAFGRYRRTRP